MDAIVWRRKCAHIAAVADCMVGGSITSMHENSQSIVQIWDRNFWCIHAVVWTTRSNRGGADRTHEAAVRLDEERVWRCGATGHHLRKNVA